MSEEQEVTAREAADLLGLPDPLVRLRMDIGDLPFREYSGVRRIRLKDVMALKTRLDETQAALDDLAEETESLIRDYGL